MDVQPRSEGPPNGRSTDRVVVGVDGTRTALNAVRWAVAEAHLRGVALRILHAAPYATDPDGPEARRVRGILGAAFTVARRIAPGVAVSTQSTSTPAVQALTEAAETAQLLVVGIPAEGPHELLPTSVALNVAGRAGCPVAVIRGRFTATDEPMLVGIDDPATDRAALAVAFAEAHLLGCELVVLHAHGGLRDHLPGHPDRGAALAEAMRFWSDRYPRVQVSLRTPHDTATNALIAAAGTARLVVVGTRGHRAVARVLFGSNSRALLRHSPVPVLVVDPDARHVMSDPTADTLTTDRT